VSVLSFIPNIEDDGKYLTCRAENPEINDSALEDRWRLNVHCEYSNFFLIIYGFLISQQDSRYSNLKMFEYDSDVIVVDKELNIDYFS
jgi:hypothetical protein